MDVKQNFNEILTYISGKYYIKHIRNQLSIYFYYLNFLYFLYFLFYLTLKNINTK